tara:strand:- start:427 stop:726 length:300 start_codon:yes stop_codon:yes gene_type:complete
MAKLSTLLLILLASCTYSPVSDSRGNQGEKVAYRFNDDLQTCRSIAKENTSNVIEASKVVYNWYVRPSLLFFPDKWEYSYKRMVNKCMTNRGHSILSDD